MGQYNLLTECYRSVLRLAMNRNLKTIAMCCLGTGGVGFPARIAARIALQETREFLDAHPAHPFERIVFCVYADDDFGAYTDFLPVFFPPTQEDLENAVSNTEFRNSARLSALIQETYRQVDGIRQQVRYFAVDATNTPQQVTARLTEIAVLIESFRELVTGPGEESKHLFTRTMQHLNLLCTVIIALCRNMTEMAGLATGTKDLGQPSVTVIWDDYNSHMHAHQGLTIFQLVDLCKEFAQHLNNSLERNEAVPHEMKTIGVQLGAWLAKQTGEGRHVRDHFEEALLSREYEQTGPKKEKVSTVKLYQVQTLAQLYDLGALQSKATDAIHSARSNYVVCLARDDITRIESDILGESRIKQLHC